MARLCVFADLDGSLFQTLARCGSAPGGGASAGCPLPSAAGESPPPPPPRLVPAAAGRDGRALSFMTEGQRLLYGLMKGAGALVPATARNLESFRRVKLPFTDGAILDFGAVILGADGKPDLDWLSRTSALAGDALPMLELAHELASRTAAAEGLDVRARLVGDMGESFYMVAKSPSRDLAGLGLVGDVLAGELGGDARIWTNGNNLAVLPPFLDKGPAVVRFMERHLPWPREETLAVGLGDSLSDLGFLEACD
ncbi:MAG: hypothetical protein LBQ79_13205, partial [Deltaproteobacteria bacterium]|nr:hypothetical protein [Deltaproteobacteria bacterium]